MKTIEECANFLERVGLATVLPGRTALFPCLLWEARGRPGPIEVADEAFNNVWHWKDQLPALKVAYAGRLLGDQVILLHRRLLPAFLACQPAGDPTRWYREGNLSRDALRLWEALEQSIAPLGRAQLRKKLGLADKSGAGPFDRACRDLEGRLLLTRAGSEAKASGWDANAYTLVERQFPEQALAAARLNAAQARQHVREALASAAPGAGPAVKGRWLTRLGAVDP